MNITEIFLDQSATLRSGWRFLIFLMGLIVVGGIFVGIGRAILMTTPSSTPVAENFYFAFSSLIALIPTIIVGWLCGRFLEKLPFRALGAWFTGFWLRHLLLGSVAGAVTVGVAVSVAALFGGLRFGFNSAAEPGAIRETLLLSLLVFAIAAAFEEALFRGYILQTFARSNLAWFAVVMTSLFFGLLHLGNPSANVISTVNTILAGVWFGVAYLKTRDLWFVWGMHLVWNWTQGSIFGIEVSGLKDITVAPLLTEIDSGPTWLTGGDYGLEGGVACTAAIVVSIIVIRFLPITADEEMLALTSPPGHERKVNAKVIS